MATHLLLSSVCIATGLLSCATNEGSGDGNERVQRSQVKVGGGCDGCELMYEGMPSSIHSSDTTEGWYEDAQKLKVAGRVLRMDGNTPVPDVILYYWHTDAQGIYAQRHAQDPREHGSLRGWVKSDAQGRYMIHTLRPAPYPEGGLPAHIHVVVKEPDINEYYIDDLVFDDDPLLKREGLEERAGSGILRIRFEEELQVAEKDVILGLNIPDHPAP